MVTDETPLLLLLLLLRAGIYRLLHASTERQASRQGDPLSQMIDRLTRRGVRSEDERKKKKKRAEEEIKVPG